MKKQVRYRVWETNSSLSHSLTIMSEQEYKKLLEKCDDDRYVWDAEEEKWVNVEQVEEDNLGKFPYRESYFDEWGDYEIKLFTTEHGDKVVGISYACEDY